MGPGSSCYRRYLEIIGIKVSAFPIRISFVEAEGELKALKRHCRVWALVGHVATASQEVEGCLTQEYIYLLGEGLRVPLVPSMCLLRMYV